MTVERKEKVAERLLQLIPEGLKDGTPDKNALKDAVCFLTKNINFIYIYIDSEYTCSPLNLINKDGYKLSLLKRDDEMVIISVKKPDGSELVFGEF